MKNLYKKSIIALTILLISVTANAAKLFVNLDLDGNTITNANAVTPAFADNTPKKIITKEYVDALADTNSSQFAVLTNSLIKSGIGKTSGITENYIGTLLDGSIVKQIFVDGLLVGSPFFDIQAFADPDVNFKPIPVDKDVTILEWDLQSFTTVDNLQYTPFYAGETHITAAQYCRFLNAYKGRFATKTSPSCAVTSVFNEAQGGAWVDTHAASGFLTMGQGISWDAGSSSYTLNDTDANTNKAQNCISWYGAVAYCQWLNDVEFGSNTADWKYRLPTEWEWEFMAGAKTKPAISTATQDWGSDAWGYGMKHETLNNTSDGSTDFVAYGNAGLSIETVIVGNKGGPGRNAVNEFDCYEVSGQLWHWCLDYWGAVAGNVSGKDYVYKAVCPHRVVRGGAWGTDAASCATSRRSAYTAEYGDPYFGFRVVRSR